ncbi:MAG: hypothetical protein PHO27_09515 [Sulfuricurvum sp.]|nr:hypothetical protein [Sulfuricurvum sp.]
MVMLKYAGPKPLISAHGIEFDHNKEDKFVYLNIVAELIKALDHDYIEDKRYTCLTGREPLSSDVIYELLRQYDPMLDKEIQTWQLTRETELDSEIEHARENKLLCEEERQVLINNITILRSYQIQRTLNKTAYYSGIGTLAQIIHKGHIEHITAPMLPTFFHVFHSIQGSLSKLHPPMESSLDIFEENAHLNIKLKIKS